MTLPPVGDDHCRVTPPAAADAGGGFEFARHLFAYAEAARRIAPSARVLEVGCGAGYGAAHLAGSVAELVATDFSDDAVAHARAAHPSVRFVRAGALDLPFDAHSFDAIVSFQVIEHIEDDRRYARELARVLRPGGALYLTTPNRLTRLLPLQRPWNPYHVREYDAAGLGRVLRVAFADVTIAGVTARPELVAREIRRGRRNAVSALAAPILDLPGVRGALRRLRPRAAATAPPTEASAAPPARLEDLWLTKATDACLDIFAVARA
jgi:SAM-dependent methyltransferase